VPNTLGPLYFDWVSVPALRGNRIQLPPYSHDLPIPFRWSQAGGGAERNLSDLATKIPLDF
jgi:hypothetical protein